MSSILRCPVCGADLLWEQTRCICPAGHSFDVARDGYVNLLGGNRPGEATGDSADMARSRRDFLSKGHFAPLAKAVDDCLAEFCPPDGNVLDICCGEGYYTAELAKRSGRHFYGFDLSRQMVRLAAKRKCGAVFFVANLAAIPVADGSADFAFHLFAPFHSREFARVLKPGGMLVSAIPGREHLMGLKELLYDKPYPNDETPPDAGNLSLVQTRRVRADLLLTDRADIRALLKMTPYFYHTPAAGLARLEAAEMLQTPIEFVLLVYKKAVSE